MQLQRLSPRKLAIIAIAIAIAIVVVCCTSSIFIAGYAYYFITDLDELGNCFEPQFMLTAVSDTGLDTRTEFQPITLDNIASLKRLEIASLDENTINSLAIEDPHQDLSIDVDRQYSLMILSLNSMQLGLIRYARGSGVFNVTVSPSMQYLAFEQRGEKSTVFVCDLISGKNLVKKEFGEYNINDIDFSRDSTQVAASSRGLSIYELPTADQQFDSEEFETIVLESVFINSELVASLYRPSNSESDWRAISFWNINAQDKVYQLTLNLPADSITSNADGSLLAVHDEDGLVEVWGIQ